MIFTLTISHFWLHEDEAMKLDSSCDVVTRDGGASGAARNCEYDPLISTKLQVKSGMGSGVQ